MAYRYSLSGYNDISFNVAVISPDFAHCGPESEPKSVRIYGAAINDSFTNS